jgi:hypothetical protein
MGFVQVIFFILFTKRLTLEHIFAKSYKTAKRKCLGKMSSKFLGLQHVV